MTATPKISSLVVSIALVLGGCTVGPNYKRPIVALPPQYRGPDVAQPLRQDQKSIADQDWTSVFGDPVLRDLINEALKSDLDLKIEAQRVLEAQAQAGITRAQQFPSISAGASYSALQIPSSFANNSSQTVLNGGGFSGFGSWALDFWGLYRRQTEAARAEVLATEWGRRATRITVIQNVAQAYFRVLSLDEQITITESTIKARQDSVNLVRTLEDHGAASLADLRQSEELLHAAEANLPNLRIQLSESENQLSVLLGRDPGTIPRGTALEKQPHPDEVPAGLPSELIERRPDIGQAEAELVAANARIGVARARFFPQISLTSLGGTASNQLNSLFDAKSNYWLAAGSLAEPIFDGGRIRNNYRLSQAQKDEMVLAYRKTILSALRDVANGLTSYRELRELRERQAAQVAASADAVRLAQLRYSGGNASYLEVLTTDTDLYSAQLSMIGAQEREAFSLIDLYTALGGGWKEP